MAKFLSSTPGPIRTRLQEFSDQIGVWVADFGAVGNGVTDDTAAFNAAIAAANGKVPVLVPAATYMINAASSILFNIAGTQMVMAPKAVLKVITNSLTAYSCIIVTTADCSIEGGTIMGDVSTHTGGTGEWGHGLNILAGADRFKATRVTAKNCWGDGFYVGGGVADVSLIDCIADSNRRQGLSVSGANRLRVIGGAYINTGSIAATAPSAGIDIEPNPSSGIDVVDFLISGANCSANVGPGIQITKATAQVTRGMVTGCTCRGNSGDGISTAGSAGGIFAILADNYCVFNILAGLKITAGGVQVNGGYYYGNTDQGVYAAANFNMSGGAIHFNSKAGLTVTSAAISSSVSGVTVRDNCWGAATTYNEVDVTGANFWMTGSQIRPAGSGNRAIYAIKVQTGATIAKFFGVTASTGTTGIISALGDTVQSPAVA